MANEDFFKNCETFCELCAALKSPDQSYVAKLLNDYVALNVQLINDVLQNSIYHLKTLKNIKKSEDVMRTQLQVTETLVTKLQLSSQHFLHKSLNAITEYNQQLKNKYEVATD